MEEKTIDGEVWINNQKTNAKLFPYISEYGFGLKNISGGFSGPHTNVNISPDKFVEIMTDADKKDIVVYMSGERLGTISQYSGYDSADLGAHARRITSYSFKIFRELDSTKFIFEGETDFLNPDTVRHIYKVDLKSFGRYTFKIWFNILDCDLSAHFKNKVYLEAMTKYIARCDT